MEKYIIKKDNKLKTVHFFDEHWYSIPELSQPIASVTTKLSDILSKGVGFEQWLRDTGNESKKIVKEAAESVSRIHNMIEQLLYGNVVDIESYGVTEKKEWKKFCRWVDWYKHYMVKPLSSELTVYNVSLATAGTLDFVGIINDEVYILDWKTGNNLHLSNYLQIASDFYMYNKMVDSGIIDLPKADKAGLVHIGASNRTFAKNTLNAPGIKVDVVDVDKYFPIFKNINDSWNMLNADKKPPQEEFLAEYSLPDDQVLKM